MKPVIGIICDTAMNGPHLFHSAGDKYIRAVRECMDATPLLIPSLDDNPLDIDELTNVFDGFLITGGYSNVGREHYGEEPAPEGENQDPLRDKNTLPLLKALIDKGIPFFAICRGLQELNVTMGGTLYPRIHEIEGRDYHSTHDGDPVEVQYSAVHDVATVAGGQLAAITGETKFDVNSIHVQGIKDLAPGLTVEAVAGDNTVEAVSVTNAKSFALAVQWHPEWQAKDNPQSVKMFNAFKAAVLKFKQSK